MTKHDILPTAGKSKNLTKPYFLVTANANVLDTQQRMTAINAKPYRTRAKVIKRQVSRAREANAKIKWVFEHYKRNSSSP